MNIELFQLFTGGTLVGAVLGIAFIVHRIIIEEQEKKEEKSRVKIHWRDRRR